MCNPIEWIIHLLDMAPINGCKEVVRVIRMICASIFVWHVTYVRSLVKDIEKRKRIMMFWNPF